jgi:hypothetical protein
VSIECLRLDGKMRPFLFCCACGVRIRTLEDGEVRWPAYAPERLRFVHIWCKEMYEAQLTAEYGDEESGLVICWSDLADLFGCLMSNLSREDVGRMLTEEGGCGSD